MYRRSLLIGRFILVKLFRFKENGEVVIFKFLKKFKGKEFIDSDSVFFLIDKMFVSDIKFFVKGRRIFRFLKVDKFIVSEYFIYLEVKMYEFLVLKI